MDNIESEYFASLLRKLKTNQSLSKDDLNYMLKFIERHEDCPIDMSSIENNDEETELDFHDSEMSEKVPKKDCKSSEVQCELPVYTDYRKLEDLMRKQWNLPFGERNDDVIKELSRQLFPHRRPIITMKGFSVRVVNSLFPYLFAKEQIFSELELVKLHDNLLQTFKTNVIRFRDAILHFAPNSSFNKKILSKLNSSNENVEQVRNAASLLLLPGFMNEDRKGIIVFNKEKYVGPENMPYIHAAADVVKSLEGNNTFIVHLEGYEICIVTSVEEAFFGLVAAYAAFNLSYPKSLSTTFAILEKLFLKLDYPKLSVQSKKVVESKLLCLEGYVNSDNDH